MESQIEKTKSPSLTRLLIAHEGENWPLWRAGDSDPYIRDIDWAQRLGYTEPRMIRKLIKRMTKDGRLGKMVCSTASQTPGGLGGRPATEFYLTEGQALKIAARSETEYADAVLDQMIAVFMKVRLEQVGAVRTATAIAENRMPANPREITYARRALLSMLMSNVTHARIPGLIVDAGPAALAERLGVPLGEFLDLFTELEGAGEAAADWNARLVWLPGCPRKIVSPFQALAWHRVICCLPRCALAWRINEDLVKELSEGSRAFLLIFRTGGA